MENEIELLKAEIGYLYKCILELKGKNQFKSLDRFESDLAEIVRKSL